MHLWPCSKFVGVDTPALTEPVTEPNKFVGVDTPALTEPVTEPSKGSRVRALLACSFLRHVTLLMAVTCCKAPY